MDTLGKPQTPPILVTGGTGVLGTLVAARLRAAGRPVRVLSRSAVERHDGIEVVTGDLTTGEGVDAGVGGVNVIVHCAGSAKGDEVKTANLVRSAAAAGAGHLVYISVVGADRIPMAGRIDRMMFGYFGAKHASEQIVAGSGLPWSTLRATQFFSLTLATAQRLARLPVIPIPAGFRFQPVDPGEVADRLVELALGSPAGPVPELAGPTVYEMAELVRTYLSATGRSRPIVSMPVPGKAAAAIRAGANLAAGRAVAHHTWEEYLAEHAGSTRSGHVSAHG